MTNFDALAPTQDERVMAALAHVSALLPFFGAIAPIVIWVTQREKSRYVAFQALQAVAYQLMMILAWFVGMGCYMLSFFAVFVSVPFAGTSSPRVPFSEIGFIFPFLIFGAIFVGGFAFIVYGVVGAVMAFQGKPFRYAILGSRVERFLQPKPGAAQNQ